MAQELEQPSPPVRFASSQVSDAVVYPSPHTSEHVEAVVGVPFIQLQPFTAPVQSDLHPSVLSVLPSSHDSVPNTLLSPQIGVHVEELKPEWLSQV